MATDGHSVWIIDVQRNVLRVDPRTLDVIGRLRLGSGTPQDVVARRRRGVGAPLALERGEQRPARQRQGDELSGDAATVDGANLRPSVASGRAGLPRRPTSLPARSRRLPRCPSIPTAIAAARPPLSRTVPETATPGTYA